MGKTRNTDHAHNQEKRNHRLHMYSINIQMQSYKKYGLPEQLQNSNSVNTHGRMQSTQWRIYNVKYIFVVYQHIHAYIHEVLLIH